MKEYAVYGIIEPFVKKIVYIDFYVYDWDKMEEFPPNRMYVEDAINSMKCEKNMHWRDLYNMWDSYEGYYDNEVTAVVLAKIDRLTIVEELVDLYREMFKPRFNGYI